METYDAILNDINEGRYDGTEGLPESPQAWFLQQIGGVKDWATLSEQQRQELFYAWVERQHKLADSLRQTAPLHDPCKHLWDTYQKASAEAAEARKRAAPYIGGSNQGDSQGDWVLTQALDANQRVDDAFKLWLDCRRTHPLP